MQAGQGEYRRDRRRPLFYQIGQAACAGLLVNLYASTRPFRFGLNRSSPAFSDLRVSMMSTDLFLRLIEYVPLCFQPFQPEQTIHSRFGAAIHQLLLVAGSESQTCAMGHSQNSSGRTSLAKSMMRSGPNRSFASS